MSYLVILNNDVISCATNKLVLSDKEIIKLATIDNLANEITLIKNQESDKVFKSQQEGYKKGYETGLKEAISDLHGQFIEYLKDLTENIVISSSDSDEEILNLACEITRKIASNIKPEDMIRGIAMTALQKLKNHNCLELKINPNYVDILKNKLKSIENNEIFKFSNIEIISDSSLGELDCIIKTEAGTTIASFDEQLNILKQNIKAEMSREDTA
jgi:flagellar biosynthesis/type III secretory pathway protein FliH